MEENNHYLRDILEQRGWYKRWHTQVMADLLLPHVARMAQPEKNALLGRFKEDENNMLGLYMVKEFLKTVGLPSTGKIFEEEAGLRGGEQEFQALVQEQFSLLRPSTAQVVTPPLLAQALHIWKVEATRAQGEQEQEQEPTGLEGHCSYAGAKPHSMHHRLLRGDSATDTHSSQQTQNAFSTTMDSGTAQNSNNNNNDSAGRHLPSSHGATMGNADHLGGQMISCRRNRSLNCKRCH